MTELSFKGKAFVRNHHLAVPYRPLISDSGEVDYSGNLLIEGDNLEALKSLMPLYAGKVNCIYIDPPYNTGNEGWCYNDKVNAPQIKQWLKDNPISVEDGLRHDKWCCMMWPRLCLLHKLLADDGVIFVSIDDNEVHRLRAMMDEIWGEANFVAMFPWRKRSGRDNVPFGVSQDYEWVLCYGNNAFIARREAKRNYYTSEDYPDDQWRLNPMTVQATPEQRPNCFFTIINPKNGDQFPPNKKRVWAVSKDTFSDYYARGKIVFPGDYDFLNIKSPMMRVFQSEEIRKKGEDWNTAAVSTHLDVGECCGQ